jgi:hypothetical protein
MHVWLTRWTVIGRCRVYKEHLFDGENLGLRSPQILKEFENLKFLILALHLI